MMEAGTNAAIRLDATPRTRAGTTEAKRARHALSGFFFVVLANLLFMSPLLLFAKESSHKTNEPSSKELAGMEVLNEKYPNGWVYADKLNVGRLYKPNEGVFEHLKKGQWYAQIYERVIEVNSLKEAEGKKKRTFIVDALIIRRRSYPWVFEEASTCKFADGSKLKSGFIASVNFERCRRYSTHIEKAWGWDEKLQKFVTQPTKGLTCEIGSFGQDPETSECVDWGKCYSHFNIARNQVPSSQQTSYCSDNFLLPKWQKNSR